MKFRCFVVEKARVKPADCQQIGPSNGQIARRRPRHHFVTQIILRVEPANQIHEARRRCLRIQPDCLAGQRQRRSRRGVGRRQHGRQPTTGGHTIRIGKNNPFSACSLHTRVAGRAWSTIRRMSDHNGSRIVGCFGRSVFGTIIDHQAFEGFARQRLRNHRADSVRDLVFCVECGNDNRQSRIHIPPFLHCAKNAPQKCIR